jgi:hypothetical protein
MDQEEGGFVRVVLTPPRSVASLTSKANLPHPRTTPLKSGCAKESMFIRFLDENITRIQRRHALRGNKQHQEGPNSGFTSFAQVAKELDTLLNLVWISGTRRFLFTKLFRSIGRKVNVYGIQLRYRCRIYCLSR